MTPNPVHNRNIEIFTIAEHDREKLQRIAEACNKLHALMKSIGPTVTGIYNPWHDHESALAAIVDITPGIDDIKAVDVRAAEIVAEREMEGSF